MTARPSSSWRLFLWVALGVNLGFGLVIAGLTFSLRQSLHHQIQDRELEAIEAVVTLQVRNGSTLLRDVGFEDPSEDVFAAVLESSRLRGVLAVQLFDADGQFRTSLPLEAIGAASGELPSLLSVGEPRWVRFIPNGRLDMLYQPKTDAAGERAGVPMLDIAVPLHAGDQANRFLGTARFWLDGRPLEEELARIDRGLLWQASVAFLTSAAAVTLILGWAFRTVQRSHAQLRIQGADLARANQELVFAAKTAAIGAISAHLVHAIKNPLSGLEYFVAAEGGRPADPALSQDWRLAAQATRRLRDLINQVVGVLRDEARPTAGYTVSSSEVMETVAFQLAKTLGTTGARLVREPGEPVELSARVASLSTLVLTNIAGNALEAAGASAIVTMSFSATDQELIFLVRDTGPGLPERVRELIFQPLTSSKPGGSGIGLALSRQLAQQMGGRLELDYTGPAGTAFSLSVPRLTAHAAGLTAFPPA